MDDLSLMASPRDMPGGDLSRYYHSRLPSTLHTRLLELFPATDPSDDLHCRIHVVEQAQAKATYEAISYTWGRPQFTCNLIVVDDAFGNPALANSRISRGRVPITPSLDGALRRFRDYSSSAQTRHLWADAICIDQSNPKEKAHHIPLMSSIYRDAAGVLIWIGGNAGRKITLEDDRFLDHPWFGRRWVIQEAVFNTNVNFFTDHEKWSFEDVLDITRNIIFANFGPVQSIVAMRAASVERMEFIRSALHRDPTTSSTIISENSICKLMRSFDHYDCADPRDRVFTLASLAGDVDIREVDLATFRQAFDSAAYMCGMVHQVRRPQIMVIYEEGASAESVYTMFSRSIGEAGNLSWVLSEASARLQSPGTVLQSEEEIVPSWVPDWRINSRRPPFWADSTDIRYPFVSFWRRSMRAWTGDDPSQPSFSITPSPAQSQITKQRVFRMQLPLTRITQDFGNVRKDDCQSLAPLRITWRSKAFPSSIKSWEATVTCMKNTFREFWRIVQVHELSSSAVRDSRDSVRDQCAERFSYVLVAGGMFLEEGKTDDNRTLPLLCDFERELREHSNSREAPSHPVSWSKGHPNMGRDIDLLYHGSSSLDDIYDNENACDLVMPKIAFLIKILILSDIKFFCEEWDLLVCHVAWAMQGRCVFACDVENVPPNASPMDILGIGSNLLELDDRIMAIPFHSAQSDSNRMRPLSLSNLWSRTYLVRPVPGGVDEDLGKDACVPTFQLVGDCFLSTVRWLSPQRGLMPREWFALDDDSAEEAALKKRHRGHFSEVVEDSVIYFV